MNLESLKEKAWANMARLTEIVYLGDLIVLGVDATGKNLVQIYATTDEELGGLFPKKKSPDRKLQKKNGDVWVENETGRLYYAMREVNSVFFVGDGKQTEDLAQECNERHMHAFTIFHDILARTTPHSSNMRPRLTAYSCRAGDPMVGLSVIRKTEHDNGVERDLFGRDSVPPGFGYCTITYRKNGKPFTGKPMLMLLEGDQERIFNRYWGLLNHQTRVAMAVKRIPLSAGEPSETQIWPTREWNPSTPEVL